MKLILKPVEGEDNWYRFLRGGSWGFDAEFARVSYRFNYEPSLGDYYLGFRLARNK